LFLVFEGGFGGTGGGFGSYYGGGGGGGAGFGGAVFVRGDTDARLVIADGSFSGSQVNGGAGSANGTNGGAAGQDLFLQSGAITTFAPAAAKTLSFNGTIADDSVASVPNGLGFAQGTGLGAAISIGVFGNPGGNVTFFGANTYSGGTTLNSGTITVGNDSALGTGRLTMAQGTTLAFDSSANYTVANNITISGDPTFTTPAGTTQTISGVISNGGLPGIVEVNGGGTLVLSGANTYSGGTNVIGSNLRVTNSTLGISSSVGTGPVTLQGAQFQAGAAGLTFSNNFKINNTPPGSAIDANGFLLTISGNITDGSGGAGKLSIVDSFGGGAVVLTGTNTYTGGTTICACAALQLGDATHTGSILGNVTNEGIFIVYNANTSGISSITTDAGFTAFLGGTTAGSATLVNKNGGTTLFGTPGGNDTSTAGNATIDNNNAGTIFAAVTNAGTANITNRNGGGTIFADQASAALATIINNNTGLTVFGHSATDTPTAGNATITSNSGGGTIFGAFSTGGNAIITANSGGFNYFLDNSTGGNAQFITVGTGFVDFSGSLGPNGDGRITAGSIAGSGTYYIGAGKTLIVGSNNLSTEVSGVIADFNPCGCAPAGPGALAKLGIGTMILSGANTYTGTTAVFGGVLDVEGSITSSSLTTVNANATLTGAGAVGNTTIAKGGIFLPGNGTPGSSMTVAGNLALQSGALYLVQLNPATSTFANVTGTVSLNGSAGAAFLSGNYVAKRYTILTAAGGVNGTFSSFDTLGIPSGFQAGLSYDANDVYLNLALSYGALAGLSSNQHNVGNALDSFFKANGSIPVLFGSLTPAGLRQVSGELATGSQQATFDAMNLFLGLLTDPFIAGRGDGVTAGVGAPQFADEGGIASAYAAKKPNAARDALAKFPTKADVARNNLFDSHWSVWGSAYGGGSTTDGNAVLGSNSTTARAFGFTAGADYRISPTTLAGFALAGGGTNFSVNGFGSGHSDLFQAGAFARHNVGAAYVSGALAYGWQDVTTDRTVTVAGIDRLRAQFNANAWSGRIEAGYRFVTPWMGITPYAAGQFTTYSLPAYAEQVLSGAGTFALNYAAKDVTASRTELGIRTDRSFAMQNAILILRGRAAWAHDFNTDRNISAVFQTLPGASFVVNGAAQAHDSVLTTGSAEMKWLNGFSLAATFEGEFSDVTRSYAGKGTVRYTW
jgi:autotransporter-associated beta strand protein